MGLFRAVVSLLRLRRRVVVLASHFVAELLGMCDMVWELHEGRIVNHVAPGDGAHENDRITVADLTTATATPDSAAGDLDLPWLQSES